MENTGFHTLRAARGSSLVELAIILPVLMLLVLGVIDFARAIQFNNILVAMSREGANLASRTTATPQNIIIALNNTANPLVMSGNGMIYITKIIGRKKVPACVDAPPTYCATYPQVQAQTRATTGGTSLPSRIWACPNSWLSDGSCNSSPAWGSTVGSNGDITSTLPMTLSDGEVVYAVEALYNYTVIVNYVMRTAPKLYSLTVL